jgi:hypothetical protein
MSLLPIAGTTRGCKQRRRMARVAFCVAALLSVGVGTPAQAAEITDVASAFDVGNPWDFNFRIAWLRHLRRADIRREFPSASSNGYFRTVDDLKYSQTTNILNLRAEFGIFHDLAVHLEIPIVLQSQAHYKFASGINAMNSTTIADGICQNSPGSGCGSLLTTGNFDGRDRSGVGEVAFGITWGVFSQKRDETKPNFNLGFDARVAVGDVMKINNKDVGDGVTKLIFWLAASKRMGFLDPYIGFRYTLPITHGNSLFNQGTGQGSDINDPRQRAAVFTGIEFIVLNRPAKHQRITIELMAEVEAQFDQRDYSEIWELLAGSPALAGRSNEFQSPANYPGITNIENFFRTTGKINFNVRAAEFLTFRAGFWIAHDSNHLLTFASAGKDANGDRSVDRMDPMLAPREANPIRRDIIDLPGRRYRLGGSNILSVFIQGSATF